MRSELKVIQLKSFPNFLNQSEVKLVFKLVEGTNFNIWIVGGAIRDYLIGKEINDIDFVTDVDPKNMLEIVKKNQIMFDDKYLNYGTIVLMIGKSNYYLTSLREDHSHDGRHSKVKFTQELSIDVSRRDLTINSLYLNEKAEIIDFFNGFHHIKNSKLIFVGDIHKKCVEDYLRILRYCRFCSIFENPVIPKSYKNILKNYSQLVKKISQKKVRIELKKIFKNDYFINSISLINFLDLGEYFFNEIVYKDKYINKVLSENLFFKN